MSASSTPGYDDVDDLLHDAGVELSAAEAHGRIAGYVCATGGRGTSGALLLFRGETTGDSAPLEQAVARLAAVCHAQLEDQGFGFEPMLPDEEGRAGASALGDWCRGFLDGLVSGGVKDLHGLTGEAGEFMKDLLLLGEAESAPEADAAEESRALAELVEYLRAGTQLIYDEFRRSPDN